MSLCPVCNNEIPESFGIVECSNCNNMLVADMDGNFQIADAKTKTKILEDDVKKDTQDISLEEKEDKMNSNWGFESIEENLVQELTAKKNTSDESQEEKSDFQEIQNFADSEDSSLTQGEYFYNLTISDLLTQEVKDEIEFVLTDPKLKLNTDEINLTSDEITLKKLNPVKVSVIVSKIKHLPIKIFWTQFSIFQGEAKL